MPAAFPSLLNIGDEEYLGTVHRQGDGAEAILNYLRSGGFLAMLTSQPLPFAYDGLGHTHKVLSLTPRMGIPIAITFEKPPDDTLKLVSAPARIGSAVLRRRFPFSPPATCGCGRSCRARFRPTPRTRRWSASRGARAGISAMPRRSCTSSEASSAAHGCSTFGPGCWRTHSSGRK